MDRDTAYRELTDIFRAVFGRGDLVVTPELTAKDVEGWDSFMMIEIIISVEQRFGFKLTTREIDSLRCAGDLAEVVAAKAAAR